MSTSYWGQQANRLSWIKPWHTVQAGKFNHSKWFLGGELNVSYNCLDRHLDGHAGQAALIWESEGGVVITYTFQELYEEVNRWVTALRGLGVKKGDRVAIYLGMVPELPIAMLACARLGAIHSVVFGGLGTESLAARIQDVEASVVITAQEGIRRQKAVPLKETVDQVLPDCPTVSHVIVVQRPSSSFTGAWDDRYSWWHDLRPKAATYCEPVPVESEDPLFVLYTSGTTGKPKGIVHSSAGYLVGVSSTHQLLFEPTPEDVYWCTADPGWITGHSYVVYGPLSNATTILMYEGAIDWPHANRIAEICERHRVTLLYTSPTVIRELMRHNLHPNRDYGLSRLRTIGSVGETLSPQVAKWYMKEIGNVNVRLIDTWWQTETGMVMLSPLPNKPAAPGSVGKPLPGVAAEITDADGRPSERGKPGYLLLTSPWPSMLRGIWNDEKRYQDTYWSKFPEKYFPGDAAICDADGNFTILGRVDDTIIVAGHNISTAEVESCLMERPEIAEVAVCGVPDKIKGQALVIFIVAKDGVSEDEPERQACITHLRRKLGPIYTPKEIRFTKELPKTRSGKIMRRILRDKFANDCR